MPAPALGLLVACCCEAPVASCAPVSRLSPSLHAGDWMKSYDIHLPEMLADGVRVMVYAGDQDLICNWLGNR